MTTTASVSTAPVLAEVEVAAVRRLSPSFVRVELAGPALADVGVDGPLLDQRIKLLFPAASGRLPDLPDAGSWYARWRDLPDDERGYLRTYSVRDLVGEGAATRVIVDFVLHVEHGGSGPGSGWAVEARPGDRLVVCAPRRGVPFGGIEFAPPADTGRLLLAGDETAVPAVCRILEDLPSGAVGTAFLEVPHPADVQDVDHPAGVEVVWLPRGRGHLGEALHAAVRTWAGSDVVPLVEPDEVDPDLWETPAYSSSGGEPAGERPAPGSGIRDYAWIAGEAGVVTALRRHLVRDLGWERRRVAFMGYWRRGVAARG